MTHLARRTLVASSLAAVLALTGAACGDDGGPVTDQDAPVETDAGTSERTDSTSPSGDDDADDGATTTQPGGTTQPGDDDADDGVDDGLEGSDDDADDGVDDGG